MGRRMLYLVLALGAALVMVSSASFIVKTSTVVILIATFVCEIVRGLLNKNL